MIIPEQCMPLILERFPGFEGRWREHLESWGGKPRRLCGDMTTFSFHIRDLVAQHELDTLPAVFTLIEEWMVHGDEMVRTAVATCFLENLLNLEVEPKCFVPLLGPVSREYCRAWDESTGVKTEGLW